MEFVKLSSLVNDEVTIKKVVKYFFQKWEDGKPVKKDEWFDGSRKMYQVETDKGMIDFSESQVATLLVKALRGNKSDISNVIYEIKSNGETGIDIRYFFNIKGLAEYAKQIPSTRTQPEEVISSDIPF